MCGGGEWINRQLIEANIMSDRVKNCKLNAGIGDRGRRRDSRDATHRRLNFESDTPQSLSPFFPSSLRLSQAVVSSKVPRPIWPHLKVSSLAVNAGVSMSSK